MSIPDKKMSFDIENVSFYRAVALFEQEQYQKAFDLFLTCANHLNLYALRNPHKFK